MARNFDFKKYKAIIDFIQSSTNTISTSIDNLIKGTIELRSKSVASIVKYSTSIKEIVIGQLSSIIGTDVWSTEGKISLDITKGGKIVFPEDYQYDDDSMLPPAINDKVITRLSKKFVKKSGGKIVLQRKYDSGVTSFKDNDIPSISFFKSNYVTIDDGVLQGKIILASDSQNNSLSAINGTISKKIAGADKLHNFIAAKSTQVLSNFFDVSSDKKVSISSDPDSLVIGEGVTIDEAPTEKSLLTSNNIDNAVIRKDLKNLTPCVMIAKGTGDDDISTENDALNQILNTGVIVSDVHNIPKNCQPSYSNSYIHPTIEEDNNAIKDKYSILEMENYLSQDKEKFEPNNAASMYTRMFALTPIGQQANVEDVKNARGSCATTIKLVYEMVALRLLFENKNLFINNEEYMNQQNISSLLLKSTSSPEFYRRPMLLSKINDIATVSDLFEALNISSEDTGGKIRSW